MTDAPSLEDPLPRWETDSLFQGVSSRELQAGQERLVAGIQRLAVLYDNHGIEGGEPRPPTDADFEAAAEILAATNELLEQSELIDAYLTALVTTDADDDDAAAAQARLEIELIPLMDLQSRFDAWVGRLGSDALAAGNPVTAEHAHALRQAAARAERQMSVPEEELFNQLRQSGGSAWSRLAGDLTSRLTGQLDGEVVPVTVLRGKATDPDSSVRERAYRAELAAWETVATPLAACLNGIKGEAVTVYRRRGWPDVLEPMLLDNAVERSTLAAMQEAAVASFRDFRRFLRAKARLLGSAGPDGGLPWWDLFAPVPGEASVTWEQAEAAVQAAFATYSGPLAGLARRAFHERWVDAGPREGKRSGAFCMHTRNGESRVLMNFDGSWDSVQTLAHELGHAYHNSNQADRTPLQRQNPMALAETASIFCETIMVQAGLAEAGPDERLALLNVDLQGACQVVVDIHSRFLFESEVVKRRADGPLSVADFRQAMVDAQRATYGDGLRDDTLHRDMWAVKPHYYFVDGHFYNWPYCFGLLFGIGLYARYQADPDRFRAEYDDLLSSTGMGTAAELAGRFGIDVRNEAFWTTSLDVLRARIDDFEALVDARVA